MLRPLFADGIDYDKVRVIDAHSRSSRRAPT